MSKVLIHHVYAHFKGKLYYVEDLATDAEDECTVVIYRALYGDFRLFTRSITGFTERLSPQQLREYHQERRFTLCTDITEGED